MTFSGVGGLPAAVRAVLDALQFTSPETGALRTLDDRSWAEALAWCDRSQLTLALSRTCEGSLPEWVNRRIAQNRVANCERARRIEAVYRELGARLDAEGLEFVVLKGFTLVPTYVARIEDRVQYDLDLYMPLDSARRAYEALRDLGYEPLNELERFPTDHLSTMIRRTGWQWRGDFFDPEIPVSVDLHYRLWDPATEGFPVPGVEQFWQRRLARALHPADALGFVCLHLVRHLLRGNLRPSSVYELGHFLDTHATDAVFWQSWLGLHSGALRRIEALAFALAERWFDCRMGEVVAHEVQALPEPVRRWVERYGTGPLEALFRPNKHELWLHLSLLDSTGSKGSVIRRRLFPARLPGPVDAVYVPDEQLSRRLRLRRRVRYWRYLAARLVHHTRALPSVAAHGVLWWWRTASPGRPFLRFLGAASLFNLGSFVFYLLYNLHLLSLGFNEGTLGWISGAMTAGSLTGSLPAGWLGRRIGLGPTLITCFCASAMLSAARTLATNEAALIALAFAGGVAFALYAVSVAPSVAMLTSEDRRARGFSLFFASGIAIGVVGGLLGGIVYGNLPTEAKFMTLLAASALMGAAAWPVRKLALPAVAEGERRTYPSGPFVPRFLTAVAVWTFAVGLFTPFFNVYFAKHLGASVERIGTLFSAGQAAQVAALLAAPALLKRFGRLNAVMAMQFATGLALAGLAAGSRGLFGATFFYVAFMALQYMSEPGIYSLLMDGVRPHERTGASAVNFLTIFSMQAIAAAAAGTAFAHFGFRPVLCVAASLAVLAGILFRRLLDRFDK